jgi:hypothetical protein
MNRHERCKAKAEHHSIEVRASEIDEKSDVGVDAKHGGVVMLYANGVGRKAVEEVFPDVEWETDDRFAACHKPEWLFTHVRVTKLPDYLEEVTPLAFAQPDAIGFAVAMAVQAVARPRRVFHYTGSGRDVQINIYDSQPNGIPRVIHADYVRAGTVIGG